MNNKIMVNVTAKDIFNAQAGKGFKEAGSGKLEGMLTGYAVYDTESANKTTGEIETKTISLMIVDGEIYSGESIVIADRVRQLEQFTTEEEIKAGIPIQFGELKVGRGTATTFALK